MQLKRFLLLSLLPLIIFIGTSSYAQEEYGSVEIDMSVLSSQPVSRPPTIQRDNRPRLTTPTYQRSNRVSSPPVETPQYNYQAPPPKRQIVSFPIKVKERTEQYDPSLGKTPIFDGVEDIATKPSFSPPLPELKPVKVVNRAPEPVIEKVSAKVPIPPKRPARQQTSDDFISKARAEIAIDMSKGGMEMPAVPAKDVQAETLAPPPEPVRVASSDALARQLVTPDKEAMVKSIETIAALADALMPVASTSQKATPLVKKTAANHNIPVPDIKPEITNTTIARIEEAIDITAIEPAAGTEVASLTDIGADITAEPENMVPRQPPEEDYEKEYLSLSFGPGITELDGTVTAALNEDIIPLLMNNPEWRLQIQAFASKKGEGLKNARRTSLSRALSIRTHLLDNGIEARRMDVRALGMQTDRDPADRVDFVFFDPAR